MGEEGTYQIQVWVRSVGSTQALEAWRGTDDFRVIPSTVLRLVGQPGERPGCSEAGEPVRVAESSEDLPGEDVPDPRG